ncbi:MAG: class I SAM-dependent methyltransferase [Bacteroidales bacterium]
MKQNNNNKSKFSESKHAKYHTKNTISKILVDNFYKQIHHVLNKIDFNSLIDLGCGEGLLLTSLTEQIKNKQCYAIDYDKNEVKDAKANLPNCEVKHASIYDVPFKNESFDLVICTEVLEHLEEPDEALKEIYRLSNKYILLSVPREPVWRILNIFRFSYLSALGNTPGHLNHWSSKRFKKWVSEKFNVICILKPLPWTIILAEKKDI